MDYFTFLRAWWQESVRWIHVTHRRYNKCYNKHHITKIYLIELVTYVMSRKVVAASDSHWCRDKRELGSLRLQKCAPWLNNSIVCTLLLIVSWIWEGKCSIQEQDATKHSLALWQLPFLFICPQDQHTFFSWFASCNLQIILWNKACIRSAKPHNWGYFFISWAIHCCFFFCM